MVLTQVEMLSRFHEQRTSVGEASEETSLGAGEPRTPEPRMMEYSVRRTRKPSDAVITHGGRTVATLRGGRGPLFNLESAAKEAWVLDPRVHGEIRPFSMNVTASDAPLEPVLTVRNHVFFHRAMAYMLTAIPEEVHPAYHLLGKRHINRLENFPFSRLEDIDLQTWGRLRMHRGVSVGTIDGLGVDEFKVTLARELEDVGLPLSAASYILYSTG